jgi:8-oxo-dGTP diphosphatase
MSLQTIKEFSVKGRAQCPQCGAVFRYAPHPVPTVDVLIACPGRGIALVARRFEPSGWALPGGFVETGERAEDAAVREAFEETGLTVSLCGLLGVYSDPGRDPRLHTISTVYIARAADPEAVRGGDDAAEARFFPLSSLPRTVFDHDRILDDFRKGYAAQYGMR